MQRDRVLSLLSPLLLLLIWELAVAIGWLNRIFYPPPSEVFITLSNLVASGQILRDAGISLTRVALGFLLGGVPAIVLGLLMGISASIRALFRPIAAAIYPIPKIALLPMIIVSLGIGEESKIATIAISVFFMVVLNVAASVLQVDPRFFEVARSFGARGTALFWTVALPGSLPGIMASIKLGMGYALTLIVGVEFVGANTGVGHLIWQSYEVYAIDRMIAALVVVALIGWLATVLLDELEYLLVPWQSASVRIRETRMQQYARTWWRAMRPWSYSAAIIPVLLGACIAAYSGQFSLWLLVLTLVGSIAIQGGTNLINDYYDFQKGTDQPGAIGTGDAILRGELTPRQVFAGGIVAFAVGSAIGLYLVSVSGPLIFWLGVISVAVGFFYTAGPFALAYNGLGEIAVFIFMGPVMVVGSYYVQAGTVSLPIVLASLPVGFLVAAILHANNLRDLETDRASGKRTLATILGRSGAQLEYYLLVGGAYLALLLLVVIGIVPWFTLISLATLPLALRLMRIAGSTSEPLALQPVLRQTAQLHLQFGTLMVAGWIVATMA
ncbi:MAG TPA: 1,4-dihydroxy-2-naphthoate octaprenyltransferase [Roseiflexaceae bacterium]|nr:1,4-dihydroxy-2-naphthoate octaprenyltransferase [Roseiflexaceae bacterium]HMP40408.1 1,4-dihydroxy-2-naphthoate octaprenyltransferase [Roseiflexaceae bacterium]